MKNNGLTKKYYHDNIYYCKEFINSYYSNRLHYRASELLKLGLSPAELDRAIKRALNSCRSTGYNVQQHFCPIYTSSGDKLIRDCKLSKFAYALVLLNASVKNSAVAAFQVKVLSKYLKSKP